MDTAQWPQEIGLVKSSMEEMASASTTTCSTRPQLMMERRARPQKEQALNCPRCNSTNTKFCYYNNYSLTQPRYFCKTCRRYWTEGGSLRNVPVGGGSRKNKRSSNTSSTTTSSALPSSSLSSSSSASSKKLPAHLNTTTTHPISSSLHNPNKFHEGQDLNLAFSHHHLSAEFGEFPNIENNNNSGSSRIGAPTCSSGTANNAISSMELLRGGISSRGLSPFMPMTIPETGAAYPSGFGLQDFRSTTLDFPMDGIGGAGSGGYENVHGVQEGSGRMLFPFEDLRQVSSTTAEFEQNRGQGGDSSGFWNGVMGGGGSW